MLHVVCHLATEALGPWQINTCRLRIWDQGWCYCRIVMLGPWSCKKEPQQYRKGHGWCQFQSCNAPLHAALISMVFSAC